MLQNQSHHLSTTLAAPASRRRNRALRVSVSALALLAGACGWVSGVQAQTSETLVAGTPLSFDNLSSVGTLNITSGGAANTVINNTNYQPNVLPSWVGQSAGAGSGVAIVAPNWAYFIGNNWSTDPILEVANNNDLSATPATDEYQSAFQSPKIVVSAGVTLYVAGYETLGGNPYLKFDNMLDDMGNLVVGASTGGTGSGLLASPNTNNVNSNVSMLTLTGSSSILGNLAILNNATLLVGGNYNGGYYNASQLTMSSTSIVQLGTNAVLGLYEPTGFTTTIGALSSTDTTGTVFLEQGNLTVDGQSTTSAPFTGTITVSPGSTLTIGDASHTNAILGDPNNTNGSTETLTLTAASGNPAILQGYGTFYGTVKNTSGLVQPGGGTGSAPGVLTVGGFSQGATGELKVGVSPSGASGLKVLGTAALGGTLDISIASGTYKDEIFPILSAGTITGSFNSVETTGDTAGAIVGLVMTSTGYDVVTESALGAQVYGHLFTANRENINNFTESLFGEMEASLPNAQNPNKTDLGDGFAAWLQPNGALSDTSHDGLSYHTSSGGLTGGIEHRATDFQDATVGIALSYANESLRTEGGMTTATTSTYDVAFYGGITLPNARINADVFYNRYNGSTTRNLGADGSLSSSPDGYTYGAALEINHGIYNDLVVPYMRGTFAENQQNQASETGGLLALNIDKIAEDTFVGDLGFRIHPTLPATDTVTLLPEITLAMEHDFSKPGEQVTGEFVGQPFTWTWKGNQTTAVVAGLRLATDVASNVEVYGSLDGRFTSFEKEGSFQIGARYRF